jgi:hypothetical protein
MPPGFSLAMPKFRQIDLAWPMWRYPFGSAWKAGHDPAGMFAGRAIGCDDLADEV